MKKAKHNFIRKFNSLYVDGSVAFTIRINDIQYGSYIVEKKQDKCFNNLRKLVRIKHSILKDK